MTYRRGARIAGPARIAALASAVRQELVDTLVMLGGEATVAELAEQLGRPADGLYYHLRVLRRVGLVREDTPGANGERRYRLADERPQLEYRPGDRRNTAAVKRVAQGLLQNARRDFDAALADPDAVVEGPHRQVWAARGKGWVSRRELAEINRLLQRLCDLLGRPRGEGRERLLSLAFVLAPLQAKPKRRGGQ